MFICWDHLLRSAVTSRSCVEINCRDYLLSSSAEISCWYRLFRSAVKIRCDLLRSSIEICYCNHLLTSTVVIRWVHLLKSDQLLRSSVEIKFNNGAPTRSTPRRGRRISLITHKMIVRQVIDESIGSYLLIRAFDLIVASMGHSLLCRVESDNAWTARCNACIFITHICVRGIFCLVVCV